MRSRPGWTASTCPTTAAASSTAASPRSTWSGRSGRRSATGRPWSWTRASGTAPTSRWRSRRGADLCLVGRAYLYGLAAAGQAGAEYAIDLLTGQLRRTMQLLGVTSIAELRQPRRRAGRAPAIAPTFRCCGLAGHTLKRAHPPAGPAARAARLGSGLGAGAGAAPGRDPQPSPWTVPDTGQAGQPGGGFTRNARAVLAAMDARGIPQAVLVGHSYGGGVALTVAGLAPHRVRALVLLASVGPGCLNGWDRLLAAPVAGPLCALAAWRLTPWFARGWLAGVARVSRARPADPDQHVNWHVWGNSGSEHVPLWRTFLAEQRALVREADGLAALPGAGADAAAGRPARRDGARGHRPPAGPGFAGRPPAADRGARPSPAQAGPGHGRRRDHRVPGVAGRQVTIRAWSAC